MWKAVRILLGLALVAKGLEMLGAVSRGGAGYPAAFGGALFGFAVLIAGALVLAPSLAVWAASPFTRFVDSIYLPGGRAAEKPEPNYRLADHYYQLGQDRLAIAEYEKIVRYHPAETPAYVALIDLWANRRGEPGRATKLYRRGLRRARSREARDQLRAAFRSSRAGRGGGQPEEGTLC